MDSPLSQFGQLVDTTKRLVSHVVAITENRLELLMVEVQEERERFLRVILLALGAAVFGLLAGVALTVAIVIFFWESSPITALLVLTVFYFGCAGWLYAAFTKLQRNWQTLPGTTDQLRKDREWLERNLA
jgi:uncharacterized membrane protein YqjE